jgi:hypothetical protein
MNKKTVFFLLLTLVCFVAVVLLVSVLQNNRSTPPTPLPPVASSSGSVRATFPRHILYATNRPNALIVIDSAGRKTGKDPASGIVYQEIPGAKYSEEEHSAQVLYTEPPAGQFKINIIGAAVGRYLLQTDVFDGQNSLPIPVASGTINIRQTITYVQNYDPNNLANSAPILEK